MMKTPASQSSMAHSLFSIRSVWEVRFITEQDNKTSHLKTIISNIMINLISIRLGVYIYIYIFYVHTLESVSTV